ncbi:MAG: hypothetical protein ABEJ65_05355, partial [bacterium]
ATATWVSGVTAVFAGMLSIAVSTGVTKHKTLQQENPDLLLNSLVPFQPIQQFLTRENVVPL